MTAAIHDICRLPELETAHDAWIQLLCYWYGCLVGYVVCCQQLVGMGRAVCNFGNHPHSHND